MGFDPFAAHKGNTKSQSEPVTETKPACAGESSFARHESNESQPKPGRTRKSPPAPQLLYWLQHSWAKPIISLREIVTYGPWGMRDRASALAQAELLEQAGWLIPAEQHQRDRRQRVWRTPLVAMSRRVQPY
jgi:hypothetical protein